MCGIVGYTGGHEARSILVAGLAAARVSRLRQRRAGDARRRTAGRAEACRSRPGAGGAARAATGRGHVRDQPHPLGHARAGQRPQCPSPSRRSGRRGQRRRGPQRRDREPRVACAASSRRRGSRSSARPTPRSIAHLIARELESVRRPVRGRAARVAAARGDLRAGGRQPEVARRGRRRPARQSARRRPGRGRALAGQRPGGDRAPHGAGRVPAGRRGRPAHARATSRSAIASMGRSRRGSTGSTGSPTRSSWAATPTT